MDSVFGKGKTDGKQYRPKIGERDCMIKHGQYCAGRKAARPIKKTFENLNSLMRGWINYFGIGRMKKFIEEYGEWMRHKVRVVIVKQWKRPRTIFKNLQILNRIGKCRFTEEDIFKAANSRLGLYRQCSMHVFNYALSPKLLGQKTKDRPGLVDPLSYYLLEET